LTLLAAGLGDLIPSVRAQTTVVTPATSKPQADTSADVPELVYVCVMPTDREIVTDTPGKCTKCGMKLEPARLKQGYACVKHDAILREHPGICPLDRRELVGVTVNVFWTCGGEHKLTEPGKCADGKDRLRRIEKQPHADHNPRHRHRFEG
jgi:hypothetical protein